MKIVIDIDEKTYTRIKTALIINAGNTFYNEILTSVAEGTPLPKGHGDLIDRDTLRNVCANNQVDITNDGNKNTLIIVDTDDKAWHDLLSEKYAPTVIPADK